MKTYINRFSHYLFLVGVILMTSSSCESDDNSSVANQVLANSASGAILRTISINTGTFDFTNPTAEWSATLEAQIGEGSSLSEVKLYSSFTGAGVTGEEAYVKSYPASIFSAGPNEYLRGDFAVSLSEVLTALAIAPGSYTASDSFTLRFEMVLTDGRTFSASNSSATVTGGSYLSSPFQYSAQFFCPLADASIFNGTYTVVADAWADYGAGDPISVEYNPADGPYTFRIRAYTNPFIANGLTAYMLVTVNPADGTATVQSNESFDYGIPIDVTGEGTVGTCTGDINLSLDFSGQSQNQTFTLTKN